MTSMLTSRFGLILNGRREKKIESVSLLPPALSLSLSIIEQNLENLEI